MPFSVCIVAFVLDDVYEIKCDKSIAEKDCKHGIDKNTVPAEQAKAVIVNLTRRHYLHESFETAMEWEHCPRNIYEGFISFKGRNDGSPGHVILVY